MTIYDARKLAPIAEVVIPPKRRLFIPDTSAIAVTTDGRFVLVAASLLIFISGCGAPPGMIFPPPERPIVWPAPPEVPRIRYVGQLQTSEDLKPAVSGVESLGRALFGKKPAYALL